MRTYPKIDENGVFNFEYATFFRGGFGVASVKY